MNSKETDQHPLGANAVDDLLAPSRTTTATSTKTPMTTPTCVSVPPIWTTYSGNVGLSMIIGQKSEKLASVARTKLRIQSRGRLVEVMVVGATAHLV